MQPELSQDHSCPICLTVYFSPVSLSKCKHIFCLSCLQDVLQIAETFKCPLCRTPFKEEHILKELQLTEKMTQLYPALLQEKSKRIKQRITVKLLIGNTNVTNNVYASNKYTWTIYVRSGEKQPLQELAERVEFQLHPTFRPPIVSIGISKGQASLTRIGWGTFRIGVKVFWRAGLFEESTSDFHHDLQFVPRAERETITRLHLIKR